MAETAWRAGSHGELTDEKIKQIDAWFRAANYLSVGQIYLYDNPLLKQPLKHEHIKPRLLGHFGTTTGLNLIYVHLNRIIKQYDLNMIYITGPGHGGPGLVANTGRPFHSGPSPRTTTVEASPISSRCAAFPMNQQPPQK